MNCGSFQHCVLGLWAESTLDVVQKSLSLVFTLYFSFGLMCLKSKRELSGHKNKGDPLSVFKILDSFKKLPRLKKQIKKIEISHGLKTHTTDDKGQ